MSLCPLLQEYGNISYQPRSEQDQPPSEPMVSEKNEKYVKKIDLTKPVVPIISIDMPDWLCNFGIIQIRIIYINNYK